MLHILNLCNKCILFMLKCALGIPMYFVNYLEKVKGLLYPTSEATILIGNSS